MKTSEILRDVRVKVAASPHPLDYRTYPPTRGIAGITKAEVLANLDDNIAWFEAREAEEVEECCDGVEYCREHNPGGRLA